MWRMTHSIRKHLDRQLTYLHKNVEHVGVDRVLNLAKELVLAFY